MIRSAVVVTLEHEATHSWPECPIEEVAFLRQEHRHLFKIKATKVVSHDDREVEIIVLKRNIKAWMDQQLGPRLGTLSCEQIARYLISRFELLSCEVLEDGENGALLWEDGE